ncbi:hypothetical protein B0H16DRAFT_1537955 [Mycena metata]|uniref:Secreted protein n=1 Tax=Mycena metata TaxID=1033252 RepID=A0AAD7J5D3_9AGAR|nr:hypothetical protein B0H16DRAFT_1537955 [Mycena metata]
MFPPYRFHFLTSFSYVVAALLSCCLPASSLYVSQTSQASTSMYGFHLHVPMRAGRRITWISQQVDGSLQPNAHLPLADCI